MKKRGINRYICSMFVIVAMLTLNGCSNEPSSIDSWKAWVLTRAQVEDYTPVDLVSRFVDERMEVAKLTDYHESFESYWWDEVSGDYGERMILMADSELEAERKDFNTYYYPTLAKLTLINALCPTDDNQNTDDIISDLAMLYLKLMGDEYIMLAFLGAAGEDMDLNNLRKLSREELRKSMEEVLDYHGFSLYKTVLSTDEEINGNWWGADNVANLAMEYKDEFFENVMAILGDFSELEQMIDEAVSIYNCEYNSGMSSDNADVYDVIYSVKDKMYVKCSILESRQRSEIKIVNKSTHLLSL